MPPPPAAKRIFKSKTELDAATVREVLIPGCLAALIGSPDLSHAGIKLAFDQTMRDAGDPQDVVERMLIEQLYLCHHRLAILHAQAAEAKGPESAKILNTAATRLMDEFRKSSLALRAYRTPPSRSFAVIHQQNVAAAGGNQRVEYRDGKPKESFSGVDGLNSTTTADGDLHEFRERRARGEEPSQGGGRAKERPAAPAMVG
jgi:hypothetical protein